MARGENGHNMSRQSPAQDVLDRLTRTVEVFCVWIESLPAREVRRREWGPREVLAHLVYHHELYVKQTEAVLAEREFAPSAGRFADINARAVEKLAPLPIPALTRRLRAANRRLCRLARANDPRRISLRIKADSKPWGLSDLIPAVEAHIRNHLYALKKDSHS
jgi:hypothetical protein